MNTAALTNAGRKNRTRTAPLIRHFSSLAEIMTGADEILKKHDAGWYDDDGAGWTYGNDWTGALATREGLTEGRAPAAALAAYEQIRSTVDAQALTAGENGTTRRRRRIMGEEGDEIDIARMLADSSAPWTRTIIGRSAPIVRLAINVALSSSNQEKQFAETVARAVAIADALTLAGYSVEIIGVSALINNRDSRGATVYTFPLKGSGDTLDTARLLSIAAPGLLRAFLFPWLFTDTGSNSAGVAVLPTGLAEMIGTPHTIARHWEGGREIDAQEQARRIIEASTAAAA